MKYLPYTPNREDLAIYAQPLANPVFSTEKQLVAATVERNNTVLAGLAAAAIALPLLAAWVPMAKNFRATALVASVLASVGFVAVERDSRRPKKLAETFEAAQTEELKQQLKYQIVTAKFKAEIQETNNLLGMVKSLPGEQQPYWMDRFRLVGVERNITPPGKNETVVREGKEINLDEWREANKGGDLSIAELYLKCQRKSMIFAANPREGKTVAAHYALYQWSIADPNLVIMVFDPHYGSNDDPKYASNWLGIPLVNEIPKNVQTCVVQKDEKDLEEFINTVADLLKWRKQNKVKEPPVVVCIDEFTQLLPNLAPEIVESIVKKFSKIATEAPKFGIWFWLILHTLTKEELLVPRNILRAGHIIMGAEMTQDTIQVSNAPRTLPKTGVEHGQAVYRERGIPAGFVTSLPVADGYMPPPTLPGGLKDILIDWSGGQGTIEDVIAKEETIWDQEFTAKYGDDNADDPALVHEKLMAYINNYTGVVTDAFLSQAIEKFIGIKPDENYLRYFKEHVLQKPK